MILMPGLGHAMIMSWLRDSRVTGVGRSLGMHADHHRVDHQDGGLELKPWSLFDLLGLVHFDWMQNAESFII